MVQHSLIVAVDLGTSTTTASHTRVRDSFDNQGRLNREKLGSVSDVKDWPECIEGATGNNCVPTDLIYSKVTRELIFWGFEAQHYLDDPFHDFPRSDAFLVETIKLLIPDPDEVTVHSAAPERHRAMRKNLTSILGKRPEEAFEDLLSRVLAHVLDNAMRKYSIALHNHKIELILAFPSGWHDQIHTQVARIGATALQSAIEMHGLRNMLFGIENVYTVSETLCGVKEWLRETVAEASSIDFETQAANLDELNVGDCFLPIDIGGGTGCLTPLRLVSKIPLGVEQLDRTQSLEVSGEAVQVEFERMLRLKITKRDYPGDLERAIYQICRKFKEEKKKCGASLGSGSKTWNCPVARLKANPRKGFEKDCIKFNRKQLEECFDAVIDILDRAIEETMLKFPSTKVIVFLGQFGGTSAYLQKRMASSPISNKVKIRHSQSGKLDVVKGAISERLTLEEVFVRKFKTLKSYGTLVTLLYGDEAAKIFPNPQLHGALPFEHAKDGTRLKVIEWALPKGTTVHDGRAYDTGNNGLRHHTWPFREDNLGFEDIIIVSDEEVPEPQLGGTSYTLWTKAHQNNQLNISGQRVQVQQIPFFWDLIMSQKLDAQGNIVGPYERDELRAFLCPKKKIKDRRRVKLRDLHYDLIWQITEMQVKVYVQATFPNQIGSPLAQLAKEQAIGPSEKIVMGESRSKALDKDIEITNRAKDEHYDDNNEDAPEDERCDIPHKSFAPLGSQQVIGAPSQHQQPGAETSIPNSEARQQASPEADSRVISGHERGPATTHGTISSNFQTSVRKPRYPSRSGIFRQSASSQGLPGGDTQPSTGVSSPDYSRTDGRRRDGCYTCKNRKKKCDCTYIFDETSGTQKCNTCLRVGLRCHMAEPDGGNDSLQREMHQRERKRQIQLGKRKARDESESSGNAPRDRSMTMGFADNGRQPTVLRSIETPMKGFSS